MDVLTLIGRLEVLATELLDVARAQKTQAERLVAQYETVSGKLDAFVDQVAAVSTALSDAAK
jgi:hypothetical protein